MLGHMMHSCIPMLAGHASWVTLDWGLQVESTMEGRDEKERERQRRLKRLQGEEGAEKSGDTDT